ncbi:hypothetical protein AALP_AA8G265300 [Arabis alpina]|uniref:Uncharacterized protein n=1 Tax=Arabis alpina TaxID=50452 RepID=A0A087G9L3_ARAAL|nr:hypothetical protein AALP_AA8G265300 [Arabis alpina]
MTHDSGECIQHQEDIEQLFEENDPDNNDGNLHEDAPMDHEDILVPVDQNNEDVQMNAEEEDPVHSDGDQHETNSLDQVSEEERYEFWLGQQEMVLIMNPMKEMEERQQIAFTNKRQSEIHAQSIGGASFSNLQTSNGGKSVISHLVTKVNMEGSLMQYGSFLMDESDQSSGYKSRKRSASFKETGMFNFLDDLYVNSQGLLTAEPANKRTRLDVSPIRMPFFHSNGTATTLQQLQSDYKEDDEENFMIPTFTRGEVGPKPPESP